MSVKKHSRAYLNSGRVNQKLRTRDVLVEVAADLIKEGRTFSVGEVADLAKVGRTTAYRYFPTQERLLAHAALWKISLLERGEFDHIFDQAKTAADKVDVLVVASDQSVRDHEKEYRAMLRTSLENALGHREEVPGRIGFRRRLLSEGLSDLEKQLGQERFERLVGAISLTLGIEALIVLCDVCLLPPERGQDIKRWAARALLDAALSEVGAKEVQKTISAKKVSRAFMPAREKHSKGRERAGRSSTLKHKSS